MLNLFKSKEKNARLKAEQARLQQAKRNEKRLAARKNGDEEYKIISAARELSRVSKAEAAARLLLEHNRFLETKEEQDALAEMHYLPFVTQTDLLLSDWKNKGTIDDTANRGIVHYVVEDEEGRLRRTRFKPL